MATSCHCDLSADCSASGRCVRIIIANETTPSPRLRGVPPDELGRKRKFVDGFLVICAEKTVSAKKREKTAHKFIVRIALPVILRVVAIVFRRGRRFDLGQGEQFSHLGFHGRRNPTNETTHILCDGLRSFGHQRVDGQCSSKVFRRER